MNLKDKLFRNKNKNMMISKKKEKQTFFFEVKS